MKSLIDRVIYTNRLKRIYARMEQQHMQHSNSLTNVASVCSSGDDKSLIFERDVEDPFGSVVTETRNCEICALRNAISSGSFLPVLGRNLGRERIEEQSCKHHLRRNLEDLIAPALDASARIVEDETTNLNSVKMIYSERSTNLSRNLGLGRPHAKIIINGSEESDKAFTVDRTSENSVTPEVLCFYSYADMLSDENKGLGSSCMPCSSIEGGIEYSDQNEMHTARCKVRSCRDYTSIGPTNPDIYVLSPSTRNSPKKLPTLYKSKNHQSPTGGCMPFVLHHKNSNFQTTPATDDLFSTLLQSECAGNLLRKKVISFMGINRSDSEAVNKKPKNSNHDV